MYCKKSHGLHERYVLSFRAVRSGELAQLARASALQAEGQGFEPPILHNLTGNALGMRLSEVFESRREGKKETKSQAGRAVMHSPG